MKNEETNKGHFCLGKSVATLRVIGPGLKPAEITALLGCEPHRSKDERSWHLSASPQEPADLEGQIEELLSKLTNDLGIWNAIALRYRIDLFCGLFLSGPNQGVSVSPTALAALGARGIELGLDIYGASA